MDSPGQSLRLKAQQAMSRLIGHQDPPSRIHRHDGSRAALDQGF